ncbi:MAG TPA: hypothetical protein PLR20_02340, partial [Syntrophales bacterium]|nr:hypothetical protein [Syntrophales bacterium]HOX95624.1 hypothetical protein [Syntrophales bacterium]HPI58205.1 hypothetical protein [Syntrophales bacterium]HPN25571.1 hypothetical protein [Syntrophales bacterium]HQM28171.1 hypothetical protein [Syntrophales bacterium]
SLRVYLDAVLEGRFEDAYAYLSSGERVARSRADYLAMRADEGSVVARLLTRNASYRIAEVVVTGDRARCDVEVTIPDFKKVLSEIDGESLTGRFTGSNMENLSLVRRKLGHLDAKYRREGMPVNTVVESFWLVKEKDGWRVSLKGEGTAGGRRAETDR